MVRLRHPFPKPNANVVVAHGVATRGVDPLKRSVPLVEDAGSDSLSKKRSTIHADNENAPSNKCNASVRLVNGGSPNTATSEKFPPPDPPAASKSKQPCLADPSAVLSSITNSCKPKAKPTNRTREINVTTKDRWWVKGTKADRLLSYLKYWPKGGSSAVTSSNGSQRCLRRSSSEPVRISKRSIVAVEMVAELKLNDDLVNELRHADIHGNEDNCDVDAGKTEGKRGF